jgi:helix-turn-helix protein
MGASKILPIHHIQNQKETASLISTSNETIIMFKQILLIFIIEGSDVEFVCPFSKGGKILLDKQPMRAILHTQTDTIIIGSEWLGKKQQELISIPRLDGFDKSIRDDGTASLILKYQKDGILISTLVTGQNRVISSLEKYIKIIKGVTDEDPAIQLDEKQFMLLQMMYTSDIDAAMATEMLGVTAEELEKIVHKLVGHKILRLNSDDEAELTELGTKYIVEQMKKNIG